VAERGRKPKREKKLVNMEYTLLYPYPASIQAKGSKEENLIIYRRREQGGEDYILRG